MTLAEYNETKERLEGVILMKQHIKTKSIIMSALLSAIVFIATYAVQIPLPGIATGGLIHLGNVALFTIAIIFGKRYGAISGAFGMALFDLLSPWVIWAPGTFVIRGIMGYMAGWIASDGKVNHISPLRMLMAMILPSIWMIIGYFGYNLLLYGDYPAAVASLPGDITQVVAGIMIAFPVIGIIQKTGTNKMLKNLASANMH
jgi:uncharacterized membrane protein